jgi:hypothetical protein
MKITFSTGQKNIRHKPVTLRNAAQLQAWADKISNHIKRHTEQDMAKTFVELTKEYPELLKLIDVTGSWNTKSIQGRLDARRKQHEVACQETGEQVPFSEEEYRSLIIEEMQKELQAFIRDTPMVAKMLHYTTAAFPSDLQSLQLGIDCIKSVAEDQDISNITEEDWLDVPAEEVAAWVTNFCSKLS